MSKLKRVVLVLMLLVLPLQAMAATLAPVLCASRLGHDPGSTHVLPHSGGGHAAHHADRHATAAHADDGAFGDMGLADNAAHSPCCQLAATVTPFVSAPSAPPDFRSYLAAVVLMAPLHSPEPPHRPPQA